jgi:hypothetical protein
MSRKIAIIRDKKIQIGEDSNLQALSGHCFSRAGLAPAEVNLSKMADGVGFEPTGPFRNL